MNLLDNVTLLQMAITVAIMVAPIVLWLMQNRRKPLPLQKRAKPESE